MFLEPKIIHRDLKSGNVLLALNENEEINKVKITGNAENANWVNFLDFDASAITNYSRPNVTVIGTVRVTI